MQAFHFIFGETIGCNFIKKNNTRIWLLLFWRNWSLGSNHTDLDLSLATRCYHRSDRRLLILCYFILFFFFCPRSEDLAPSGAELLGRKVTGEG